MILASLAQRMGHPMPGSDARPDIVIVMTDEERAIPPYESAAVLAWRQRTLTGRAWFQENGVSFAHHYTGSLACPQPADYLHRASRLARCDSDRRDQQSRRRLLDALAPPTRSADIGQLVPGRGLRHALRRQNGTSPTRIYTTSLAASWQPTTTREKSTRQPLSAIWTPIRLPRPDFRVGGTRAARRTT